MCHAQSHTNTRRDAVAIRWIRFHYNLEGEGRALYKSDFYAQTFVVAEHAIDVVEKFTLYHWIFLFVLFQRLQEKKLLQQKSQTTSSYPKACFDEKVAGKPKENHWRIASLFCRSLFLTYSERGWTDKFNNVNQISLQRLQPARQQQMSERKNWKCNFCVRGLWHTEYSTLCTVGWRDWGKILRYRSLHGRPN